MKNGSHFESDPRTFSTDSSTLCARALCTQFGSHLCGKAEKSDLRENFPTDVSLDRKVATKFRKFIGSRTAFALAEVWSHRVTAAGGTED